MHLLRAVAGHGPTDFILLDREGDTEPATETLETVRPLVRTCNRLRLDEWAPTSQRWSHLPWRLAQVAEALTLGAVDAPRFSDAALARVSQAVPERRYDVVFACRLSSASIVDGLIARRMLTCGRKVVDFDDMLSRQKRRAFDLHGAHEGRLRRSLQRVEMRRIARAEVRVARDWAASSFANPEDAAHLTRRSGRPVMLVPNVVDRPLLPEPDGGGGRILFVGHLSYDPNARGLTRFLNEIWPEVRNRLPTARLDVVGMRPKPELVELAQRNDARLHVDVPSVEPFYGNCDLVVAPIWEGGGTRIKILEAMAYGRPVVSTTVGAEGLGVRSEVHAMIADDPAGFARAVVRLATEPELRGALARAARVLQQTRFGPDALRRAVATMIDPEPGAC